MMAHPQVQRSWPVRAYTGDNQLSPQLLVISDRHLLAIDPQAASLAFCHRLDTVERVSWDRRSSRLFRVVLPDAEVRVFLSPFRGSILRAISTGMLRAIGNPPSPIPLPDDRLSVPVQGVTAEGVLFAHILTLERAHIVHSQASTGQVFSRHTYADAGSLRQDGHALRFRLNYTADTEYRFQ
ncbi:hypothetical protein KIPB_012165, partial [Kipferlia bialata]|eukprot:g12165.t1